METREASTSKLPSYLSTKKTGNNKGTEGRVGGEWTEINFNLVNPVVVSSQKRRRCSPPLFVFLLHKVADKRSLCERILCEIQILLLCVGGTNNKIYSKLPYVVWKREAPLSFDYNGITTTQTGHC